jgi:predicted transcriptional regulator
MRAKPEFDARKLMEKAVEVMKRSLDERKVQRILKKLHDSGLVRRFGKGRATRYTIIHP